MYNNVDGNNIDRYAKKLLLDNIGYLDYKREYCYNLCGWKVLR